MSVSYQAVLEVSEDSVLFLSQFLHRERQRRGTRTGTRALGTYRQAVLILRWFSNVREICLGYEEDIRGCSGPGWSGCCVRADQP